MAFPGTAPQTSTITVHVFDGTRTLVDANTEVTFTIRDDRQNQIVREDRKAGEATFPNLRYYNTGDNYTVLAWAPGYEQAGFTPVKATPASPKFVDLMLLRKDSDYSFSGWDAVNGLQPKIGKLLAAGAADDTAARERYFKLMEDQEPVLACVLNLTAAMSQIHLREKTVLDYFKVLNWDDTMKQDRFWGYADARLLQLVQEAVDDKEFAPELGFELFHKNATNSYKQVQFGEANVQLTFHGNDRKMIDGVECVLMEPDIDYYKDELAHTLLEVLPNGFTGELTNPRVVYVLRWMASRHAGVPEFDPLYTIV